MSHLQKTMKRFNLITLSVLICLGACNPLDRYQDQQPDQDNENGVENYTPEIPTDENGYDGGTADDSEADNSVTGNSLYWENMEFSTTVNIVFSGAAASVTSSDESIPVYVTGADVTLDLNKKGAVEVIAQGNFDAGQIKIYGDSEVKLTLNGLELTSDKRCNLYRIFRWFAKWQHQQLEWMARGW